MSPEVAVGRPWVVGVLNVSLTVFSGGAWSISECFARRDDRSAGHTEGRDLRDHVGRFAHKIEGFRRKDHENRSAFEDDDI